MNKGSILEGKSLEIGGLMQQDTEGKIEHLRKKPTNCPDGGIDYERVIKGDFDYKSYNNELKKKGEKNEG